MKYSTGVINLGAIGFVSAVALATPAIGQDAAGFYKGKTITMTMGTAAKSPTPSKSLVASKSPGATLPIVASQVLTRENHGKPCLPPVDVSGVASFADSTTRW